MNERKRILNRIEELNLERCETCSADNLTTASILCPCPAAVEIRSLGDQLLMHRSSRRSEPETDCRHLIKRFSENMTVDVYRQLREQNYSIMRIATEAKIPKTRLHKWRQENGFVHSEEKSERPMRPQKHKTNDPEYKKYLRIAEQNGISRMTFYHRVRISNWDYEKAATETVQRQVHKQKVKA